MEPIYHNGLYFLCFSSIVVYGSVDTAALSLLTLRNPEGSPVLCLKHSSHNLFAALQNGTVMVYTRSNNGKVPEVVIGDWLFFFFLAIFSMW